MTGSFKVTPFLAVDSLNRVTVVMRSPTVVGVCFNRLEMSVLDQPTFQHLLDKGTWVVVFREVDNSYNFIPHKFKNVAFSRETFIRRITCPGCGRVETREANLGTIPTRPASWRYAGTKRGHGPVICPDCEKTLEPYYVELRAWNKKRDTDVGDAFREAQKGIVKSKAPTYPPGWRTA